MNSNLSAAPYANLLGIRDASSAPLIFQPVATPSFLPHFYIYAQKGDRVPELVTGATAIDEMFGSQTLKPRSPYYNHQTKFLQTVLASGGSALVQRVFPEDIGPKSRLLLSAEIVDFDVPQYERLPNGMYRLDAAGQKVPTGTTVLGKKVRWLVNEFVSNNEQTFALGEQPTTTGLMIGAEDAQSTRYPILELEAAWHGAYGNNLGLRLMIPHGESNQAMNVSVATALKSHLFRMALVERADANATAKVVPTISGAEVLEFSFDPVAFNEKTATEMGFEAAYMAAYDDAGTPGTVKKHAPFKRVHVYQDNLEAVLHEIGGAEAVAGTLPLYDDESPYVVNPFTALNFDGVPYYNVVVSDIADGGTLFSEYSTHYATGGSDGVMSDELFDGLVRAELDTYGENAYAQMMDRLRYPCSTYFDSGFRLETKYSMLSLMGKRKDIWVAISTQDILEPQNTPAEDSSIALALATAARNYPESEYYGTRTCRAAIVGHSGKLLNSDYKKLMPLTLQLAYRCAEWMSDPQRRWAPGLGFDKSPYNHINLFNTDTLNIAYKDEKVRNRDWANGLIWAESFDHRTSFWPATKTVYPDDTSVLNGLITMIIAVDLEKVALRAWRELTGIQGLTDLQFIERSDRMIAADVEGRYENRVRITPETTITGVDANNGYSWSTKIHMAAPNQKTLGNYTIEASRIDVLEGA